MLCALGAAAWAWHPAAPSLALPSVCPGLLDVLAVRTAVAWPAASLGPALQSIDRLAFAAAVVVFAHLARGVAGGWLPALAASLALFWLPASASTFGVSLNVGLFAAAVGYACLLGLHRAPVARPASTAWLIASTFILAMTAAISPAMTIPMCMVAIVVTLTSSQETALHRRAAIGAIAAAGVFAVAWTARTLLPETVGPDHVAVAACMFGPADTPLSAALDLVVVEVGRTQPYVLALAAVGVFCFRRRFLRPSAAPLVLFSVAPVAATILAPGDLRVLTFAPTMAIWLMAAAGLSEVMAARRRNLAGGAGAVLLLALVPLLTWSAHAAAEPEQIQAEGHDTLSLDGVVALRVQLPPGSVIVREDVVTDTLLHASVVVLHNTDIRPEIVPLESTAIAARIADRTNVYALPEAQRFLRGAGFVLVNPNLRDLSGVARVTRGGPCVGLQSAPTGLSRLAGATSVALSAPTLADVGPMVAYLSVDGSESPRPVEWPAAALRGYHVEAYSLTDADRSRLANDLERDELSSDWLSPSATRVLRLELWRTAGAPRSLPVDLGAHIIGGTGRLTSTGPAQRLQICPAMPFDVQALRLVPVR